jgi:hypothetical protein
MREQKQNMALVVESAEVVTYGRLNPLDARYRKSAASERDDIDTGHQGRFLFPPPPEIVALTMSTCATAHSRKVTARPVWAQAHTSLAGEGRHDCGGNLSCWPGYGGDHPRSSLACVGDEAQALALDLFCGTGGTPLLG